MLFVHRTVEFDRLKRIILQVFKSIDIFDKPILFGFIKLNAPVHSMLEGID